MSDDLFADIHAEMEEARSLRRRRQQTGKPYNNRAWQNRSKQFLFNHPVCLGCGARSQVADHIVPLGARGDDVLLSPIQPLCYACHGIKFLLDVKFKRGEVTEADLMMDSAVAQALRRSKPAKYACDVSGISLDPNHPWRQEINRRKGLK
jgi:hypothetical protein